MPQLFYYFKIIDLPTNLQMFGKCACIMSKHTHICFIYITSEILDNVILNFSHIYNNIYTNFTSPVHTYQHISSIIFKYLPNQVTARNAQTHLPCT